MHEAHDGAPLDDLWSFNGTCPKTERIYQPAEVADKVLAPKKEDEDPAGGLADKETDDPLATAKDFGYPGCPAGTNCHEQQQRVQRLQQLEQQQTVFSVQGDQDLQGRTARMQRQRTRLR